ncbi:hypothetical protein J2X11_002747 [Aeromicrobium panaciterrae]|uniref:Uncharacterized protein n=1 Tax=Aeromicrobium panaciterrae TaxID=363861 RepID=A0ABU1URV8_9ACTN|nr:hypothetical protein [Aeromicrobium panaciterrae]
MSRFTVTIRNFEASKVVDMSVELIIGRNPS